MIQGAVFIGAVGVLLASCIAPVLFPLGLLLLCGSMCWVDKKSGSGCKF